MSLATRNFKANVNWKIKNSENGISSTSKVCTECKLQSFSDCKELASNKTTFAY